MTTETRQLIDDLNIGREEANMLVDKLWDPLMNNLPSKNDTGFDSVRFSYYARKNYIGKFGFALLTKEVIDEIEEIFNKLNIKEFLEIEAGTGFLTKVLNDRGFAGKACSLPIPEDAGGAKKHWGLTANKMYRYCIETDTLRLKDIRELNTKIPKIVISSWIPYRGGEEVIEFFELNSFPEYYMVIGEGWGGCTASDEFHEWLDENFEEVKTVNSYKSFNAIWDKIEIYKRRK